MNVRLRLSILGLLLAACFSTAVAQQKVGYVNSQELLAAIPAVQKANSDIEALRTQLTKKGEGMVEDLRVKYQDIQTKESRGELSPVQLEEEAKKIQEDEAKIKQFEADMQKQLGDRQTELLQPVMDSVNTAINEVAEAEGFQMIFDASLGVILYADDATNITAKVKAKLGIE